MKINLNDIVNFLDSKIDSDHALSIVFAKSITDDSFGADCIGWCSDSNADILLKLESGNVLVSQEVFKNHHSKISNKIILIPVETPRLSFQKVLKHFFVSSPKYGVIHPSASIDSDVSYNPETVIIDQNVVIDEGCVIGDNVRIAANTVIKSKTIIGDNCAIGCNCTIGSVGFGYQMNEDGDYELIPHLGNVVIHDRVEISNNVCIDRAVMGSTIIGENVKIDNLVHIAHGVEIGRNSLIIAHAMIAGSVKIGKNVWVAPSSSFLQKLTVGDDSIVGLGSVVVKSVDANSVVAGNPAKVFHKK